MINDFLLHDRENNSDTEQHLQENSEKFETDCQFLLKCMLRGEVLTRKEVVKKYEMNDRRLGNLHEAGKCERRWVNKPNGKRSHVEYFITPPSPPTKSKVINLWEKELKQGEIFPNNLK